MGSVVDAVDRYADIPEATRAKLKARMARREYDDLVSIRRDSISGHAQYGAAIRDMHFGTRQLCHSVSRAGWSPSMEERGLVYCEGGQCILVPTVCRNVSRITRAAVADARAEAADEILAVTFPTEPLLSIAAFDSPSGSFLSAAMSGSDLALPPSEPELPFPEGSTSNAFTMAAMSPSFIGSSPTEATATVAAPLAPVPEPHAWALVLSGLAALVWFQRRRWREL